MALDQVLNYRPTSAWQEGCDAGKSGFKRSENPYQNWRQFLDHRERMQRQGWYESWDNGYVFGRTQKQ